MFNFDSIWKENIKEEIKRYNILQKCLNSIIFQKKTKEHNPK